MDILSQCMVTEEGLLCRNTLSTLFLATAQTSVLHCSTCSLCIVSLANLVCKIITIWWKLNHYLPLLTMYVSTDDVCHMLSLVQLLNDMGPGGTLDWLSGLQTKHGWKTVKVVFGPMWYQLVCLHPDTAKVVLRSGTCLTSCDSSWWNYTSFSPCSLALPPSHVRSKVKCHLWSSAAMVRWVTPHNNANLLMGLLTTYYFCNHDRFIFKQL